MLSSNFWMAFFQKCRQNHKYKQKFENESAKKKELRQKFPELTKRLESGALQERWQSRKRICQNRRVLALQMRVTYNVLRHGIGVLTNYNINKNSVIFYLPIIDESVYNKSKELLRNHSEVLDFWIVEISERIKLCRKQ